MATVSASLTAKGAAAGLKVKAGRSFTYSVSGTFSASWNLQYSEDGYRWTIVASGTNTGDASGTIIVDAGAENDRIYRFVCTSFTSGTIVTALTHAAYTLHETFNPETGVSVFKITDTGITTPAIAGATLASPTLTTPTLTTPTITSPIVTEAIGASTIALGSTIADAAALPAGTARIYPTTAADDTVGVKIHANDKVTGRMLFIGNGVADKVLKVYGPSGAAINGGSADAAFSSVSGKGVIIVCLSSSGNTWLAW